MGNHSRLRKDKYELQADEAVERIFRGETGVARTLTPVTAALLKVPTSRSERIAAGMRESLETAFGADFSEVRVHAGQEADAVARQEGAAAFTSGLDIYFASGEYRPAFETGQRLLAHELAHVIQQTGRAASSGRMRATDVRGSGEIQRQSFPEFSRLTKLHEPKEEKEKTKYKKVADKLAEIVKNKVDWTTDAVIADQIEEFKKKPPSAIKDWPAQAESLLYDSLKAVGKTDAAISLIKRDNFAGGARIKTVLFTQGVIDYFAKDLEAVYASLTKHPVVKGYWAEFWRIIKLFLFQPLGDPPPVLYGSDESKKLITLKDYRDRVFKAGSSAEEVTENEWALFGLDEILDLDERRFEKFKKIQSDAPAAVVAEAGGKAVSESAYKNYYSRAVIAFGKDVAAMKLVDKSLSKVAEPFYHKTGKEISKIGEDALKIWSRVSELERERMASGKDDDPIKELAARKDLKPLFKGLGAHLTKLAVALFKPGKDKQRLPSAAEYVTRAAKLAEDLRAYSRKELEKNQARFFIQGKTEDLIGVSLLFNWVYEFAFFLSGAGRKEKGALVAESKDFRVAHRIRVARRLYYLASELETFGWGNLLKEARRVLLAEGESESQFALLSDWEEDKDAPIEKMLIDFDQDSYSKGLEPITARLLVYFFQAQYYEALAEELRMTLPADITVASSPYPSQSYVPLLNAAVGTVRQDLSKFDRPRRWKVKQAEGAVKDLSESDVANTLSKHPKTAALIASEYSKGRFPLFPLYKKGGVQGVLLWMVPSYYKLIERLRKVDLLNLRVGLELKRAGSSKKVSDLTVKEWLELIRTHALRNTKDRGFTDKDQKALSDELLGQRDDAYKELIPEMRKAFNHHRLVLALHNIAPGLTNYSKSKYRYYDEPLKAISGIDVFGYTVAPAEDRDLQLAALTLELAPNILIAFTNEDRFDLIGYLYRIEETEKTVARSREVLKRDFLPLEERTDKWIDDRLKELAAVKPRLKGIALEAQQFNGFRATASNDVLINLYKGLSIRKDIAFEANNKTYTPIDVVHSFVYHATYGYPPAPGKTSTSSYLRPKVLDEKGEAPLAVASTEVILIFEIDGKEVKITASDTALLDEIAEALDVQTFQLYIAGTAFVVNKIGEVMLEGAELIPGVGQGITAARLGAVIADFFISGSYKEIKKFFGDGLKGVLEGLLEDIKKSFTAENVFLFLVFGDPRLDALVARFEGGEKKKKKPPRPGGFGKVRQVIEAFRRLGRALLNAMGVVNERVNVPVRGFQGYVASHPAIGFVLRFAADHMDVIAQLATLDLSKVPLSKAELEAILKKEQESVGRQVRGIVDAMEHFELPEKVLNTEPIWGFIVEELLEFIMDNMGLKGKLIGKGLKESGLLHQASKRIAKELVDVGLDPNYFWTTHIVPEIEGSFNTTRSEIVDSINSVLGAPAFGGIFKKVDPPSAMKIELEGEGFPETKPEIGEEAGSVQLLAEPDGPYNPDPEDIPTVRGGMPLDPGLRSDLESSYGHDFRHVRLHTDSEAAPMTRAFGAQGLTTGSHIYLKPGFDPDAGRGREVLQHELVHVLQQTGARPLGSAYSSSPSVGSPNKKLDYDPRQEAAASAASTALSSQGASPGPVSFGQRSEEGFQPMLDEYVLSRFLKKLSDLEDIRTEADLIDKMKTPALAKEMETAVLSLVTIALRPEDNQAKLKGNDPFTSIDTLKDIQANLAKFQAEIRRAALVLANLSTITINDPATATRKKPKKIKVLNPGAFVHRFEGHLLGRTGIRIVFERNEAKDPTNSYEILPANDPIKSLKITGIHLPFIGGTSPLWIKAIENTWSSPGTTMDAKTRADIQGDVRIYMAANNVITGVWATGKEYEFNKAFKALVDVYRTTTASPKLELTHVLPSWNDYVNPDPPAGPAPNDQIGLRIGKYGDETQTGQGRESHHTTQYLLGEYFSNNNSVKAFKAKWAYSGVDWKDDEVFRIRKPGAKYGDDTGAIKVKDTEIAHGKAMPAVLLAAETHEGGDMHVTPEPDDITKTGPSRQGNRVNREFYSKPGMSDIRSAAAKKTDLSAYIAKAGHDRVHKDIYNAAQKTYQWMRGEMLDSFKSSMPRMELEYYKDRYRERNPADLPAAEEVLFKAALEKIPGQVETNNDTRLEALGWHKSS